jgi:hypothetical protein
MILTEVIATLDEVKKLIESAYKLLSDTPTATDLETAVKNKLLSNIKNTLVQNVINVDMITEIDSNPGNDLTLEAILSLISDTEEMLA